MLAAIAEGEEVLEGHAASVSCSSGCQAGPLGSSVETSGGGVSEGGQGPQGMQKPRAVALTLSHSFRHGSGAAAALAAAAEGMGGGGTGGAAWDPWSHGGADLQSSEPLLLRICSMCMLCPLSNRHVLPCQIDRHSSLSHHAPLPQCPASKCASSELSLTPSTWRCWTRSSARRYRGTPAWRQLSTSTPTCPRPRPPWRTTPLRQPCSTAWRWWCPPLMLLSLLRLSRLRRSGTALFTMNRQGAGRPRLAHPAACRKKSNSGSEQRSRHRHCSSSSSSSSR